MDKTKLILKSLLNNEIELNYEFRIIMLLQFLKIYTITKRGCVLLHPEG